jgi:tetraacyldisaccharide 4'-kinase
MVICTLKDAVKLAPIWPATAPALWYVSQALEVESGREALENLVAHAARPHSKVDLETPRASSNP